MATTTPRLNLPRPEPEDLVTRANHNALVDAIDANAETPAGAQAKADEAEQNAKDYTDDKVADIDVPVTSVNGKTGAVNIDKSDVGLSNVTNDRQATKTEFDNHVDDTDGVHGASKSLENNRIVQRDANGRINIAGPTSNSHGATKGYTDQRADAARDEAISSANQYTDTTQVHKLTRDTGMSLQANDAGSPSNFDEVIVPGDYYLGQGMSNHPLSPSTPNGFLSVRAISQTQVIQVWNTIAGIPRRFVRVNQSGWTAWEELESVAGSQAKAEAAEQAAKSASVSKSGDTMSGDLVIDKSVPVVRVRTRHETGHVSGLQAQDKDGVDKWSAGYSPSGGSFNFYDHAAGHTALLIEAGANGRELFRGHETWNNGNQGNPNNLNTSSKQVVGAINEVRNEAWANRNAPSSNQSDSGYQKFPTGLMMAYVKRETSNISEGSSQITFPTAFVRTPSITATIETQDTNPANNIFVSVSQASNTGCYVHFNVPSSVSLDGFTINVQAIGY